MVVLLGFASIAAVVVILVIAWAFYQGSEYVGIVVGILLFLLFAVLFPPYAICYISVLYIASGGDVVVEPVKTGGLPGIPPAPPAPPSYGAPASPVVGGQAPGGYGASSAVPRQGGDDAWKAAADPLAAQVPRLRRSRRRLRSPRPTDRRAPPRRSRPPSRMPARRRRRNLRSRRRRRDRRAEPNLGGSVPVRDDPSRALEAGIQHAPGSRPLPSVDRPDEGVRVLARGERPSRDSTREK